MAILEVRKWPDDVLRRVAEPVAAPTEEIRRLVADMRETMYVSNGVGLAAPQVGRSIRLIVVDPSGGQEEGRFRAVLNPEIMEASGEITCEEGCLSVPGETAEVTRAEKIRLRGLTPEGEKIDEEISGFPAVIYQHEIDHLDGLLFVDRLSRLKRSMILKRVKKGTRAPAAARTAL